VLDFRIVKFGLVCLLGVLTLGGITTAIAAIDYDIVYVRQPRHGDNQQAVWPEVFHPTFVEPGSDLMLLHPDGSEEVLVEAGEGAVTDPFVSFNGKWVFYAFFHQVHPVGGYNISKAGSDIFKINLETREVKQLTHGEFTPNTGAGTWHPTNPVDPEDWSLNMLRHGIVNLGPCPVAGGKVAFVSGRNAFTPPRLYYTAPTLQLHVMDDDGSNVQCIAPMNIGSAMHPAPLKDGRLLFSSYEAQGVRDSRMWGAWAIWPDGRHWEPVISSFLYGQAFHFVTQLSDEDLVIENYYNLNNFGFGTLYRLPSQPPAGEAPFHSWDRKLNPPLTQFLSNGVEWPQQMSFTPKGISVITPFSSGADEAAAEGPNGERVGKFTHPCGAPNNDLLVAYSGGPVNALNRPEALPAPDAGLYLIPNSNTINGADEMVLIKNSHNWNEVWPRPVVTYRDVYGVDEPAELEWLPNDGSESPHLPEGTPYGLVGTSSLMKRDTKPGYVVSWLDTFNGLDAFNTSENEQSSNWFWQGADAGLYKNSDIWAIRLLMMEPITDRYIGPNQGRHFRSHASERLRILGEIPVRKFDPGGNPILDATGNPDTSFLAKIPADTPFTFQALDKNGMVLNMAQTWHQVRPGEVRQDCGGCHAHSQKPLDFATTEAAKSGYQLWDLTKQTPLLTKKKSEGDSVEKVDKSVVNVEFYRDIRPILKKKCAQCHTKKSSSPPGNLVLDDRQMNEEDIPGDYARLAADQDAEWGHKPIVTLNGKPKWRQTNASRYVRMFQSRRSLLIWKLYGKRLDGWKNKDHPTERVPGNANTLPDGAEINESDLDFKGSIMPPPDSGVEPLTDAEKLTFVRWIDLGCPINLGEGTENEDFGWFLDDLRPTLTVSSPRPGNNPGPLHVIRVGVADAYSGIRNGSLKVNMNIPIAGRVAGANLADLMTQVSDGVYETALSELFPPGVETVLHAEVADKQGNITQLDVEFTVTN